MRCMADLGTATTNSKVSGCCFFFFGKGEKRVLSRSKKLDILRNLPLYRARTMTGGEKKNTRDGFSLIVSPLSQHPHPSPRHTKTGVMDPSVSYEQMIAYQAGMEHSRSFEAFKRSRDEPSGSMGGMEAGESR